MFELNDWTFEKTRGLAKGRMGSLINKSVREVTGERLGGDEVAEVAGGDDDCVFGMKKGGEFFLEFAIKFVVTGRDA